MRHFWPLTVLESVQFSAEASRSQALSAEETLNINTRIMNTNKVRLPQAAVSWRPTFFFIFIFVYNFFFSFQVQDLLLTKVTLLQVSLASPSWTLSNIPVTISPQGSKHLKNNLYVTVCIIFISFSSCVCRYSFKLAGISATSTQSKSLLCTGTNNIFRHKTLYLISRGCRTLCQSPKQRLLTTTP